MIRYDKEKAIWYFLEQKALEITGVLALIFIPYWVGLLFSKLFPTWFCFETVCNKALGIGELWFGGFLVCAITAVAIFVIGLITVANWDKAKSRAEYYEPEPEPRRRRTPKKK